MSQVLVMSDDPRLEESVRVAGLKVARVRPADLSQTGKDRSPGALVLDARGQHQLPAGLGAFRKQHPGSGVVLVTSTLDPRLMLEAMRAGVTECVHEPMRRAIAAQGTTSRSANLAVCVDDPNRVGACDKHVVTNAATLVNTDPGAPADYNAAILAWVQARLADD